MICPTCCDFAELLILADRMDSDVPGFRDTVNAFLTWHISAVHGLSFLDFPSWQAERPSPPALLPGPQEAPPG